MSLYRNMQRGGSSYGVVPGKGNPRADDKVMNAAEGHVVPAENAHIAKRLVADMGYDPNVKVDMNNGNGQGANIKISSKEYFLNGRQVDELKRKGINPESLSPNSPYNETNAMKNGGSLYGLMMNNNNQYTSNAAYQSGGKIPMRYGGEKYAWDPENRSFNLPGAVGEQGSRRSQKHVADSYGPEGVYYDPTNPRPTLEEFNANKLASQTPDPVNQGTGDDFVVDYASTETNMYGGTTSYDANGNLISKVGNTTPGESKNWKDNWANAQLDENSPETFEANGVIYNTKTGKRTGNYAEGTGDPLSPERMEELNIDPTKLVVPGTADALEADLVAPEEDVPVVTEDPLNEVDPADPAAIDPQGTSPQDEHLKYLQDKLNKNANQEIAANLAMMGWNASRERTPIPKPIYNAPRELVRDYEGMKGQAETDLARQNRASAYQMKQLGMTDKLVALDANSKQSQMKIDQSIWDMQQTDSMRNVAGSNQAMQAYTDKVYRHGAMEAQGANQFAQEKGKNISDNTAQIFDVKDNQFNNEAQLKGYEMNQKMDALDDSYNKLDKGKILNSGKGYVSRDNWYKLSDEEREQYSTLE